MKVFGVIYLITNKINGLQYVGQTTNSLNRRINQHKRGNQYIDRAIRKHGLKNFTVKVLEECETREQLNEREIFWIAALNTKRPNGYNVTDGGKGVSGFEHTPEHNAKIGTANKGKKRTAAQRANISAAKTGTTLSPEHCANIAASLIGIPKTPEHCFHISAGQRTENPYKNLRFEMDARQMSGAALAKLLGLPHQTISEKMRGRQNFTASQAAKMEEFFGKPAEYLLARDDGVPITFSKFYRTPYRNLLNEIERQKFTYKALAKILGFAQQNFSAKMRGELNFTAKDKAKLVEIFNKPIEYLMFKEEF